MWLYAIIALAIIVGIVWWAMREKNGSSGDQIMSPPSSSPSAGNKDLQPPQQQ